LKHTVSVTDALVLQTFFTQLRFGSSLPETSFRTKIGRGMA